MSTLFFLSDPVPFNGQKYQKQKGSGTSYQSLFRLRNNFKNIPKIASANLCKSVDDTINYSTSICPFDLETVERKGKNCKNLNIVGTKRDF